MNRWIQTIPLIWALSWVSVAAADNHKDWRKDGTLEEKVAHIIQTLPSTANIMIEIGKRYQDLYWAAKLGKWEFAQYQVEEIEGLLEVLQITRPGRAASTRVFLEKGLTGFEAAFKSKDWNAFSRAFQNMHAQCMSCHIVNDHAFIVLPVVPATSSSLILNLPHK